MPRLAPAVSHRRTLARLLWTGFAALGFLVGLGVWAAPPKRCASSKTPEERKSCFQAHFQAADKRLNATYRRLRKTLPLPRKDEMKKDSRAWISYKQTQCVFEAEMQHQGWKRPLETDTFFACVFSYTKERENYLRKAFGREGVAATLEGEYRDTYGGSLTLRQKDGKLHFQLHVVRGPTHHVGEISGVFERKGATAVFSQSDDMTPPRLCTITAIFRPFEITLHSSACSSFHGARAYFDGLYRKTK